MTVRSKLARISDLIGMAKATGILAAINISLNRYRYDHKTSFALPVISPTTPYHVQIETSRVCNLRCKMCAYSFMENKGITLRLEDFKTILSRFPAVSSVDLTGIGEPFCNPDFLMIIKHAKRRGLRVDFNTNGSLLTEERMDALIAHRVDGVHFSVDAATKATHERIRVHSSFEKVLHAIRKFAEKVAMEGTDRPQLRMTFTMSKENIAEASAFVGLGKSLGVNRVLFRDIIVFERSGYRQRDRIAHLEDEELASLRQTIRHEGKKHGVETELDMCIDAGRSMRRLCRYPWMTAYVDVFGNLYPCCMVTQRDEEMTQYAMGNLLQESFEQIWNNDLYQQLRGGIIHPTEIPPLCRGCRMLRKESSTDTTPRRQALT